VPILVIHRIVELVDDARFTAKATVFGSTPPEFAAAKKTCRIRKCLCSVYLQVSGEVAERLKAAVC
jgi:hypothetical protein